MPDQEARRIRDLVAKQYRAWSDYEPAGRRAEVLRALLWEIDHPSLAEQTPEMWSKWIDVVEPRWPDDNTFRHPEWVEQIRREGMESAEQILKAIA